MSGELMETYDDYGHIISKTNNNNNNNNNNKINTEDELILSSRNNNSSSAHNNRIKYYRSLQKLSEKKIPPNRANTSPKSETRVGAIQNNINNNNSDDNTTNNTNDQESRRFSDPQKYYRSDPIAIPIQSSNNYLSSHRFRFAAHPRLVVDSSASYVLPAASYIPTPQKKNIYLPFNNNNNNNNNDSEDREGMRKKLSQKYRWEDKQFNNNNNNRNNNNSIINDHSSQEEDDDGGFAFEMEL